MEYVTTPTPPGGTRPLQPQAVVLLNPVTGLAYAAASVTTDSTGEAIDPAAWSHVYAYNGNGELITDTASDGSTYWVKTFSYTAGNLTGETKWVRQ